MQQFPLEDDDPNIDLAKAIDTSTLPKHVLTTEQAKQLRHLFGVDADFPHHVLVNKDADMAFCSFDVDAGDCEIMVTDPHDQEQVVHEVSHYVAFSIAPDVVVHADRDRHEAWADLCLAAWANDISLPNVELLVKAFFAKG